MGWEIKVDNIGNNLMLDSASEFIYFLRLATALIGSRWICSKNTNFKDTYWHGNLIVWL